MKKNYNNLILDKFNLVLKNEYVELNLIETTESEIMEKRLDSIPIFIYKLGSKLFMTELSKNASLVAEKGHHCGECHNCYPSRCSKVACLSVPRYIHEGYTTTQAINATSRIEKYDFIEEGYETFNTNNDVFIVLSCCKYERHHEPIKVPFQELRDKKLALASIVYPDVESYTDVVKILEGKGLIKNPNNKEGMKI